VKISIEIPDLVAIHLQSGADSNIENLLNEALIIELYRRGSISIGFVARVLKMGVIEADQWLAQRGIPSNYDASAFESDLQTIRELFPDMKHS